MQVRLKAEKDVKGSETKTYTRFVFGYPGDPIAGGVYISHTVPIPDELVVVFKEVKKNEKEAT
jgi:hypothetical protein